MADWAPPSDSALEEGKPIRDTDIRAIRDLPSALARGAPGAPTLSPWAMARAPVTAGDTTRFKDPVVMVFTSDSNRGSSENVNLTGVYTPAYRVGVMNDGEVRVKWTQGRRSGTGTGGPEALIARVRAGVYTALSSAVTNTNNNLQEDKSYDATIEAGDSIVWMFRTTNGGNAMQIYNFELATDGELLHPFDPFFTFGAVPT